MKIDFSKEEVEAIRRVFGSLPAEPVEQYNVYDKASSTLEKHAALTFKRRQRDEHNAQLAKLNSEIDKLERELS